ncbi:MAG: class I SAM-dependent RNA methyltransferase [Desulfovibrio sp.]|nr:class I SAM-dependent RNA methyltransferase [Desulfovibrio sp.]
MSTGIISSLKITDLSPDGRGVGFYRSGARGRGMPVFVAGALPGQTVACQVLKNKKTFIEGRVAAIEIQRDDLARPTCEHEAECGGCPLRSIPYPEQLRWKEKLARDALIRIGKFTEEALSAVWRPISPSPLIEGFRNKIELAFGADENGASIPGFRKTASRETTPVERCPLVDDDANKIIAAIRDGAVKTNLPASFWRFLILRRGFPPGADEPAWIAVLKTAKGGRRERGIIKGFAAELFARAPKLAAFVHEEGSNNRLHSLSGERVLCLNRGLENRPENALFEAPLGGRRFQLDVSSFFQVNDGSAENLAKIALEFNGSGKGGFLLDLYCGAGAPGLLLASGYDSALGVDLNPASIKLAKYNAGKLNAVFRAGDVGKVLNKILDRSPRTVLLDPPRAGLDPRALATVIKANPEKIIYISCDAATFARDAKNLRGRFEPVSLASVDMFPHTPKLELASLWTRKS